MSDTARLEAYLACTCPRWGRRRRQMIAAARAPHLERTLRRIPYGVWKHLVVAACNRQPIPGRFREVLKPLTVQMAQWPASVQ